MSERAQTALFTANYGEAADVDLFGGSRLPRAYSGHNGFSAWGKPPAADDLALLLGFDGPPDAATEFTGCRTLATISDGVSLRNQEQGLAVMLCRPTASWPALWPKLTHFN